MRKRILVLTLILAILAFTVPMQANAQGINGTLFFVGSKEYVSGKYVYQMDVAPFVENGRTYVPVRYLADALGVVSTNIMWDAPTQTVSLTKEGHGNIYLTVGGTILRRNTKPSVVLDAAPVMRHNRVFLPARYVAEAFGETVSWEPETNGVLISKNGPTIPNYSVLPEPVTFEDNTPLPRYTWQFRGGEWYWDSNVSQGTANTILEYYKKKPRPHRSELDYITTYCMDAEDDKALTALANELRIRGKIAGLDKYETIELGVSFVQGLEYVSDSLSTGYDEYPRYPIETLLEQRGDCEDTSIFLATMLRELGFGSALIFLPGHCAVGVKGADTLPGTYYLVDGVRYYYLETTAPGWPIGTMPEEYLDKKAIVLPLP